MDLDRSILLNKNINFNKNKTESKMQNPTHQFKETNLVLQLIEESQIKSETVMSWSSWKKKEGIFVQFILSKRKFFSICVLSQFIVYWIHFQNKYTFTYQKAILHKLFCLFLKSSKAFRGSLSSNHSCKS